MSGLTTIAALPRAGGGVAAALVAERAQVRQAQKTLNGVYRDIDMLVLDVVPVEMMLTKEKFQEYLNVNACNPFAKSWKPFSNMANPLLSLAGAQSK